MNDVYYAYYSWYKLICMILGFSKEKEHGKLVMKCTGK